MVYFFAWSLIRIVDDLYLFTFAGGDYMVTTVIYISLRRLVLKICFKVFEDTEYRLSRERFHIFWEHATCDLLCRQLVDSVFIYLYREIGFLESI